MSTTLEKPKNGRGLRTQLQTVEGDMDTLKAQKRDLITERDEAIAKLETAETFDRESADAKAASAAAEKINELDKELFAKQEDQTRILKLLGRDIVAPDDTPGRAAGARAHAWDVDRLLAGDAYGTLRKNPAIHMEKAKIGDHPLGEIVSREGLRAGGLRAELGSTDAAGLIQPDFQGLVTPDYRPLSLLDLLPQGTTDSNLIEYVQIGTRPSSAAPVAEGAPKPSQTLTFEDADAPIRTIAGYIKVRKQALDDAAGLRTVIDTELRYNTDEELEAQVIAGNGIGQNLTGLLNVPGILEPDVTGSRYTSKADKVHGGITALFVNQSIADGVVLNPWDWEEIRLSRDNSGAGVGTGGYLFGAPALPGLPTLWGLRPIISEAIPEGTALVGAFRRAAVLMYRQGLNVLVSDSDQDDFTKNRVTILAELRAGLPVYRPKALALIDLTATAGSGSGSGSGA